MKIIKSNNYIKFKKKSALPEEKIDWNFVEEKAKKMSTEELLGAIYDIKKTIDEQEHSLPTGKYWDELSVYRSELNRRGVKESAVIPSSPAGYLVVKEDEENPGTWSVYRSDTANIDDVNPEDKVIANQFDSERARELAELKKLPNQSVITFE